MLQKEFIGVIRTTNNKVNWNKNVVSISMGFNDSVEYHPNSELYSSVTFSHVALQDFLEQY